MFPNYWHKQWHKSHTLSLHFIWYVEAGRQKNRSWRCISFLREVEAGTADDGHSWRHRVSMGTLFLQCTDMFLQHSASLTVPLAPCALWLSTFHGLSDRYTKKTPPESLHIVHEFVLSFYHRTKWNFFSPWFHCEHSNLNITSHLHSGCRMQQIVQEMSQVNSSPPSRQ